MRDVGVQGAGDGDQEFDLREVGEEERGLDGEVAACGGAGAGEAGEAGTSVPGGGEGREGVVEPVPECFDVGEDVDRVGLGEESVGGSDEEGGVCETEVYEPVKFFFVLHVTSARVDFFFFWCRGTGNLGDRRDNAEKLGLTMGGTILRTCDGRRRSHRRANGRE